MFVPNLYRNENRDEMLAFITQHSFGILVSQNKEAVTIASHIPFYSRLVDNEIIVTAHVSKSNEQWQHLEACDEVLVIFQGPHTYISSSWYDHVNVPTWNYIAVHLYGKASILQHNETIDHLNELVSKHEASEQHPVSLDSMSIDYVEKEMKGLVAFEIKVSRTYSAFKLSQNRDSQNIDRIILELEKRQDENSLAIANALKKV
jgi:transcriptional regulator